MTTAATRLPCRTCGARRGHECITFPAGGPVGRSHVSRGQDVVARYGVCQTCIEETSGTAGTLLAADHGVVDEWHRACGGIARVEGLSPWWIATVWTSRPNPTFTRRQTRQRIFAERKEAESWARNELYEQGKRFHYRYGRKR
jgi:hypothetical protein